MKIIYADLYKTHPPEYNGVRTIYCFPVLTVGGMKTERINRDQFIRYIREGFVATRFYSIA